MKNKHAQEMNRLRNKSLSKKQRRDIAIKANLASQKVRRLDKTAETIPNDKSLA